MIVFKKLGEVWVQTDSPNPATLVKTEQDGRQYWVLRLGDRDVDSDFDLDHLLKYHRITLEN